MLSSYIKHLIPVLAAILIILWQLFTQQGERSILNRLDYLFYDWRAQVGASFSPSTADSDVVIVDVDEASIQREGRWPWSRTRVAVLIEELQKAQATVTAFDVVFSEPETTAWLDESLLNAELSNAEQAVMTRVSQLWQPDTWFADRLASIDSVLGFFMQADEGNKSGVMPLPLAALPDHHVLLAGKGYTAPLAVLQEAAVASGFVTTFPDADGVIRRTPVVMAHKDQAYPSLSLAAAMTYLLAEGVSLHFTPVGAIQALAEIQLTDEPVPTDAVGRVLVPFRQARGHFRYIPAWEVLAGKLAPGELNGKLVFVGTSSIGLADLVSTPFATGVPGVEVQGLVAEALMGGRFPHRPVWEPGATLTLQVMLTLFLLWLFSGRRPLAMVFSATVITGLLVAINLLMWVRWQMEFPMVSTLVLVQVLFGWYLVQGFVREYATERRLRGMFAQYIPPAHIEQMLDAPEDYSMAGESKELTVLFSDIRSFTTISEQLSAAQLKALLNTYFTPITEAIFRNDGTIDKYVGDMVMAFWGAPVTDPDHRAKAVSTALEMQRITQQLSTELMAKGLPEIRIGVGLNTGMMNVGDMGSEYRKAYTVLGDAVNLGSRLESLTKFYGVDILVGEETIQGNDAFAFRFCDRIVVKGKNEPINAYEPLGLKSELDDDAWSRLERYNQALLCYRQRDWQQADVLLQALMEEEPNCRLYSLYLERVVELGSQPLPEDWDGVFRHTSK